MSFAGHAKQAEQASKKELPPLVAQELTRVVESESVIRIRTFREKFSGILDNATLDVLDTQIAYLEAENEAKKQRENQEFCDKKYMAMIDRLMKEEELDNPLFVTVLRGNVKLTAFLLSKGFDVNMLHEDDHISSYVFFSENPEIFRALLEHGMEIPQLDSFDFQFQDILMSHEVRCDDWTGAFTELSNEKIVIDLLSNNKIPIYELLLYYAISAERLLLVDYLLNNGRLLENHYFNLSVAGLVLERETSPELLTLLLNHGLKSLSKEELQAADQVVGRPCNYYTVCVLGHDDSTILHLLKHNILAIYPDLYQEAVRTNRTALVEYILSTGYDPNAR